MSYYRINNTSKPIEYKTWVIEIRQVTENHLKMLKGIGVCARAILDEQILTANNGQQYRYSGNNNRAEFETTNKEQEAMLKLLYGDKLVLLMIDVVLPNTYNQTILDFK